MTHLRSISFGLAIFASAAFSVACSAPDSADSADKGIAVAGSGGSGGIDVGAVPVGQDWPAEPVFAPGAPAGADALFAGTASGAGCVVEPQKGTMLPRNWLRPRFRVNTQATAYQVTLSSEHMSNDLVGYGGPDGFILPVEFWDGIAGKAVSEEVLITATVRAHDGAAFTESTTSLIVAPVNAGGAMVYWASSESKDNINSSDLYGFSVGEESSDIVLEPADISGADLRTYDSYALKGSIQSEWSDPTGAAPGDVSCIGCHTSTPDGAAVAFNDGFPWDGVTASIEADSRGQRPLGITDLGARLLATPAIGTIAFSAAHWADGAKKAVATFGSLTPYNNVNATLGMENDMVWINLSAEGSADFSAAPDDLFASFEGSGWGIIARTGDLRAAANPAWNHTGDLIAYASSERVAGGHVGGITPAASPKTPDTELSGTTEADLYTVPFNEGAGGTAKPVLGAAEEGVAEYYPDFSPDGKLLAFNRAASTTGYIYYRPDGEVNVIPTEGGVPHRLVANDPPACSAQVSPGVINSWPKWGPSIGAANGGTYYWVVFSSARAYPEQFEVPRDYYTPTSLDTRSSQLYLAAVFVAADGTIESFPGVYIWNQNTRTSNLTPAWDEFKIPPVTVK